MLCAETQCVEDGHRTSPQRKPPGIPENKWKTRPCQEYREFAGPSLQLQVTRKEANSEPVGSGGLLWLGIVVADNKASGKE